MNPMIAKYAERRTPRYTSYPTAPHFGTDVTGATVAGWLSELSPDTTLSLYLHVPFCRKVCWYCACNMKLAARVEPVLAYADRLAEEIDLIAGHLPGTMPVTGIHWGGGTPTAMPLPALARLTEAMAVRFAIAADAEIAFEIDPRTFTPDMAPALAGMGATRASLGVQEFDGTVQATVNRIQPADMVAGTVDRLRDAGITRINFDLMYGLPHQTVASLERTVDEAVAMGPDRIALFGYAHVPWMAKNQRMIPEEALPGAAERFAQAEAAAERLVAHGYQRIGLDHFARPGDTLAVAAREGRMARNFQGYVDDPARALIGMGATSISSLPQGYAQNVTETGAWGRTVAAGRLPVARGKALSAEDRMRRALIERLMCDLFVDTDAVAAAHGRGLGTFAAELARCAPYVEDGLCAVDGARIRVTEAGRPAMRVIAAEFDAYLKAPDAPERRHAVAV